MPVLAIAVRRFRPLTATDPTASRPESRMMLFPDEGTGDPILIPYAPREVQITEDAGEWANLKRAGLKDALLYTRPKLRVLKFTLVLADKTFHQPGSWHLGAYVQTALSVYEQLKTYAKAGTRMRVAYSSSENGTWRITDMALDTLLRDDNNEITHCTVAMTLTEASDVTLGIGPVSGGVTPPPADATPAPPAATAYYTVVRGDTLWAIAVKYYGDGNRWGEIASANGISDPRSLAVGTVLRIP